MGGKGWDEEENGGEEDSVVYIGWRYLREKINQPVARKGKSIGKQKVSATLFIATGCAPLWHRIVEVRSVCFVEELSLHIDIMDRHSRPHVQ